MQQEVLAFVKGVNGQIELLADRIRIRRKGVLSILTQGLKGEKEILLTQISSVQFKRATWMTNGFIQFAFLGGQEAKGGLHEAIRDENTVMFNTFQQEAFEAFRATVSKSMGTAIMGPSAVSPLDELEKLASLRDRGIVSEEEFQLKKKQLLGL